MNIVNLHIVKLNLWYVAYIYNGEIFEFCFHCEVGQESRYQMVQTTSRWLLSFQRYNRRQHQEFRMLTCTSVVNSLYSLNVVQANN